VPKRPVFSKELAHFFVSLRDDKGWGQRQAADFARRRAENGERELKPLTRQVMLKLEAGKTKNVEPAILRAVAALYGKTYEEIVTAYIARRFDLPWQTPALDLAPSSYVPRQRSDIDQPSAKGEPANEPPERTSYRRPQPTVIDPVFLEAVTRLQELARAADDVAARILGEQTASPRRHQSKSRR
jgi:hypothetical protein